MGWLSRLPWIGRAFRRDLKEAWRRGYDAAAVGRRTDGWTTPRTSANAEIGAAIPRARDRARDLVRNNPHAAKARYDFGTAVVDVGIRPRPRTGDAALDVEVRDLWEVWEREAYAEGEVGFYGLQLLAAWALFESGEVFLRRRWRRPADGLPVPLQVQILEADFLDATATRVLANGGRIVQGVEFDPLGARVAYHLHADHPGEPPHVPATFGRTVRVDATEIAHLYVPLRPGQVRGVPWTHPVVQALRDYDDGRDAERVRRKIEACLAAFVYGGEEDTGDEAPEGIGARVRDADGRLVETFRPGMIGYVPTGKEIKVHAPASVGGFAEYSGIELHSIAAGLGTTYEDLTGDLSRVNFSSIRLGQIQRRKLVRAVQRLFVVPMICRPAWRWFVEAAIVAGKLPDRVYPVEWSLPFVEEVDREKDAKADLLELSIGTASLGDLLARRGKDLDQHLAEIAEAARRLREEGIALQPTPYGGGGAAATGVEKAEAEAEEKAEEDDRARIARSRALA